MKNGLYINFTSELRKPLKSYINLSGTKRLSFILIDGFVFQYEYRIKRNISVLESSATIVL